MKISRLRHRVRLCTQKDVVVVGTTDLKLAREEVMETWANITTKQPSAFSPHGASLRAIARNRETQAGPEHAVSNPQTHIIVTRYHRDLNVSVLAWIYEARLKSSPRWFKVLRVSSTEEMGSEFFMFSCRLFERGDNLLEPEAPKRFNAAVELPVGVKL